MISLVIVILVLMAVVHFIYDSFANSRAIKKLKKWEKERDNMEKEE
jgi:hypothetical protein